MICSDLVMSSACVALAVSGIWGDIPIWLIFIVLFIRSIGNAFYAPSLQAIMPSILPKDQLTKYAGYSQSFESASMIASPAIAAVLYSMFPLKAILMLDVLGAFLQCVPWRQWIYRKFSGKIRKKRIFWQRSRRGTTLCAVYPECGSCW